MEPRDFLSRTPPFDGLDPERARLVERSLEITYAPRGDTILRRRDPANRFLFVIRKGSVRLERDAAQPVQLLEEGDLFGYPSLLSGESPTVDVIADEDTLLYRIPKPVFDELLAVPSFGEYFLSELAGRLRATISSGPSVLAGSLSAPVSRLVTRPAVFAPPQMPIVEAARLMTRERISSLLISSDPIGILTDRDLRSRVIAEHCDPAAPVSRFMTTPVRTLPARATLFEALVEMLEGRNHHLPVVDGSRIIGVVTDTDLLRHQLKSPLYLLRLLDRLSEPEEFSHYAHEMAAMVDILFQGNLDALEIGRIVASLNDAAAKRLMRITEERLGPPPTDYAWIVFGSEGRMEQTLLTDQDNALVYGEATEAADAYFTQLAQDVVAGLARLGIPRCPGGFMATKWNLPLAKWERQFHDWIRTPEPEALIEAANFFDFRPVHGALSLESLEQIMMDSKRQKLFLGRMAKNAAEFRPPLGLFRRIREKSAGVDIKKGGIIPIVGLARVYALEHGIRARGTVDRLTDAAEHPGSLSRQGSETLREAFRFLLHLRLGEQLRARRAGETVDNAVRLDDLSAIERRHLKDTFVAVSEIQDALAQRYGTSLIA